MTGPCAYLIDQTEQDNALLIKIAVLNANLYGLAVEHYAALSYFRGETELYAFEPQAEFCFYLAYLSVIVKSCIIKNMMFRTCFYLFLFCYERDFMKSLTKEKRYDLIYAFNSTSRYLDDLLNIDNIHFELMVHRIYPAELQLNKATTSDTEAAFIDLNLSIHNDIVSTKNI